MSINNEPRWTRATEHLPRPGVVPPPYLPENDNGERSATSLLLDEQHLHPAFVQKITYSCAHHRTTFSSASWNHPEPKMVLTRLVLALHAYSGKCHCFKADWESHLDEAPTKREMTRALQQALQRRDHEEHCRVRFETRIPVGPFVVKTTSTGDKQTA